MHTAHRTPFSALIFPPNGQRNHSRPAWLKNAASRENQRTHRPTPLQVALRQACREAINPGPDSAGSIAGFGCILGKLEIDSKFIKNILLRL